MESFALYTSHRRKQLMIECRRCSLSSGPLLKFFFCGDTKLIKRAWVKPKPITFHRRKIGKEEEEEAEEGGLGEGGGGGKAIRLFLGRLSRLGRRSSVYRKEPSSISLLSSFLLASGARLVESDREQKRVTFVRWSRRPRSFFELSVFS